GRVRGDEQGVAGGEDAGAQVVGRPLGAGRLERAARAAGAEVEGRALHGREAVGVVLGVEVVLVGGVAVPVGASLAGAGHVGAGRRGRRHRLGVVGGRTTGGGVDRDQAGRGQQDGGQQGAERGTSGAGAPEVLGEAGGG